MVAGDLVVLKESQTSGYKNGMIGLVTKVEQMGSSWKILWVLMPDDKEVPFWPTELRKIDDKG